MEMRLSAGPDETTRWRWRWSRMSWELRNVMVIKDNWRGFMFSILSLHSFVATRLCFLVMWLALR